MNELIKYFNENYSKNNYIIKNKKLDRYYLWDDINDFKETGILKSEGLKEYGDDNSLKYCMIKIEDELPDTMYLNLLADNDIYNGILYKTKEKDNFIIYESSGGMGASFGYGYLIFDTPLINATVTITKKNLTFPKINYPKSTIQIYKAYQIIKSYGIKNDEKLNELFNKIKLPQPKTIEENELYANCLYDLDDSSLYGIDKIELLKDCPYMRKCEGGYGYCYTIFEGDFSIINNPVYIDVELEYISDEENTKGELTTYKDRLFYYGDCEELENFGFISVFRSSLTDEWEYKKNKFSITISKTNSSISFSIGDSYEYVEKATLTIYQAKNNEQIYTSQIYNLDAQKLINKDKGLKDFAKKRDTILNGSVRLIADNDVYYDEDTVGENSCSFGGDALGDFSFTVNHGHANGKNSFAAGNTYAEGEFQFTLGKYNITDEENKYVVIVGNGEPESHYSVKHSNAHTLDWKGNAWYKGNVSIDGTPTEDKDLTTKKYVDDYLSPLVKKVGEVTTQVAQEHVPTATTTYLNNMFNLVEIPITDSTLTLTSARNQTPTGGVMVDGTTIVLPKIDYFTEIHLFFKADANMNLTLPDIKYQMTTDIVGGKIYEFIFTHLNGLNEWIGGYVAYV